MWSFRKKMAGRRVYGNLGREERRRKIKSRRSWKPVLKLLALLALAGFIVGTGVVAWVSRDLPDPNKLTERRVAESTKIYDRTGTHLLYEVYQDQKRTVVELGQMSPWIPKATIAIEDKHFYEHKGVRLISIARAGFNNLIGRSAGSGGASTLTQQLIKKTIVGDERTIWRKIKEAIMAIRLEKKYSKDDILKLYLNEIPYGSTNYGVEAASQSYFHKHAIDITLPEAATIAAMTQAPSRYLNNPNLLRDRRDLVLRLMFEQEYITEQQKIEAQNEALRVYRSGGILAAPHFVLYIKQLLADQFGENLVDTGGLKVITSLDYDKQSAAETIVKTNGDKFAKEANANNAALVAIDPKTAQILALVGSRDFYNDDIDGQFNVATLARRQPGSSFKPFVYTLAFSKGYTPETVLYDVSTNFDLRVGGNYTPKDYDGKERGLVTMRKALQGSLNIPAVKILYLVGSSSTVEFAKSFGYTTLTGDYGLSLVLGGAEVNLLEHTNAYATLADNGVYHAPAAILKVENQSGEILYEWKASEGTEVVKPELAALISSVLSDNKARAFMFGLNSTLVLSDRPMAAKTGTTNDNKDAWTLGYTPSLTAGVWVGNTIPKPMKSGGNTLAGKIWNQFMKAALASTTPEQFPSFTWPEATKPVLRGADGGIRLMINKNNGKIATSSTPENLIITKTYLPPHDILYYVDKDDPTGPAPAFPADDPQYDNWEKGLQEWAARQQASGTPVTLEEPPTEYDTLQNAELTPTIEIISPAASSTVTSRDLSLQVTAAAPRGVASVAYLIDGINAGSSETYPFGLNYHAQDLKPGWHVIKAIAVDDQGNSASVISNFNLDAPLDAPDFAWFDGSPLLLNTSDYPRVMILAPWRWEDMKEIKIYLKSASGEKWIYTFNHAEDKLFNNRLSFTWKHNPGTGNFTLRAVMTDNEGKTLERKLDVVVK